MYICICIYIYIYICLPKGEAARRPEGREGAEGRHNPEDEIQSIYRYIVRDTRYERYVIIYSIITRDTRDTIYIYIYRERERYTL